MSSAPPLPDELPEDPVTHFYLRVPEGKVFGPVSADELDQWVTEGRLDAACEIRGTESSVWRKAPHRYPVLALPEGLGAGCPFMGENRQSNRSSYYLSPRGGLTLVLALIGIIGFCPIFSLTAWMMAYTDLEHMAAERMNPDGRPFALWTYYLGMLTTIGYGLIFMALLMISLLQLLI